MKVVELDRGGGALIQAIRLTRETELARTGVHASTIINDILRRNDPAAYGKEFDDATRLSFQEVGNVVEDIIAAGLAARIPAWNKPLPRTYRGITGSPDGHSPRASAIDEMKACWKSEREFLTLGPEGEVLDESLKFVGYKMQILLYMKMWDADRGRLHVLFINGNYKPPFPNPRTFLLKPTRAEKDRNFEQIHQHGVDMGLLRRSL